MEDTRDDRAVRRDTGRGRPGRQRRSPPRSGLMGPPGGDRVPVSLRHARRRTILRYDNAHGDHERHAGDAVEPVGFSGLESLYRRFEWEIEHL